MRGPVRGSGRRRERTLPGMLTGMKRDGRGSRPWNAGSGEPVPWRDVRQILTVCLVVGVLSAVSNWTSTAELSGQLNAYSVVRKTVSKLLSSGTVWAAVAVFAGYRLRRPFPSALGGGVAAELTLVIHYGFGRMVGIYPDTIWRDNLVWFYAGVLLCVPLGVSGLLAARGGRTGIAARLLVPVGAMAEPQLLNMLSPPQLLPWPERWSSMISGVILVVAGLAGTVIVLWRARGYSRRAA